MSYYLLIYQIWSSNFWLLYMFCFWIFIFQLHLLKFNFYINFGPHFYNCYLFFPYHFFIEFFYLSNLILICFLFEIIYEMLIIIILISSSFIFFNFLDLISIILIVIYFIWDNLWNYIFFSISFSFNFLICNICSSLF
jgi:hypothetical protein